MIKVNPDTKLADRIISKYRYALTKQWDSIYKAYEKPSKKKIEAWETCKAICREYDGDNLMVAGAGSYNFSAVFTFVDKTTQNICIAYITKGYNRYTTL